MTSRHQTLERLNQQIQDDSRVLMKLMDRQTAGEKVTTQIEQLEAAIEVKIALTEGLRR